MLNFFSYYTSIVYCIINIIYKILQRYKEKINQIWPQIKKVINSSQLMYANLISINIYVSDSFILKKADTFFYISNIIYICIYGYNRIKYNENYLKVLLLLSSNNFLYANII